MRSIGAGAVAAPRKARFFAEQKMRPHEVLKSILHFLILCKRSAIRWSTGYAQLLIIRREYRKHTRFRAKARFRGYVSGWVCCYAMRSIILRGR
jgi:hypothetical protein